MATKKILISELKKGMFIHELDISWIASPFLRHRRKMNTDKDILLLKKAGVKELVIDLSRTQIVQEESIVKHVEDSVGKEVKDELGSETHPQADVDSEDSLEDISELKKELKVAKELQGEISALVNQLASSIKEGRPPSVKEITPIINKTRESLKRNDQALLTMLHLYRQDVKLSDHGFGVFAVVLPLAMHMGCTEEEVNELGLAALLHDTGWSRLPMHLFGKKTLYTSSEKKLIAQHPGIVENVLNKSPEFSESIKKLVKHHHELSDGSGFPDGLAKGSISKLVKILQVADVYDEYIHGLNDKPGMLPFNALKLLHQSAKDGLYDGSIVSELIRVMGIYPLTSAVQLNTREKGLVEEINKSRPLLPKVKIVYEANGEVCCSARSVDLSDKSKQTCAITKVIEPLDDKEDPLGLLRCASV